MMLKNIPRFNLNKSSLARIEKCYAEQTKALLKQEVLQCKSVKECAEIYDKYLQEADKTGKRYLYAVRDAINVAGLVGLVGLLGASVLTGNLFFSIAGVILGSSLCAFSKTTTRVTSISNEEKMDILLDGKSTKSDVQKVSTSKYLKAKVKKMKIQDLFDELKTSFPVLKTPEKEKIARYLLENYDEYSWNPDMHFCIRKCGDAEKNPNYENFKKLYNLSENIFRFFARSRLQRDIGDLKSFNSTGSVFEWFREDFPELEMTDFIPVSVLKDENGIITNVNYDKFNELLSSTQWTNGLYEALMITKNLDGSIAWDAVGDAQMIYGLLKDGLKEANVDIKYQAYLVKALSQFVQNSYDKEGKVDVQSLRNSLQALDIEIYRDGLPNSKILRATLSPYLLQAFGVKDVITENVADTAKEQSKLYDMFLAQQDATILEFLREEDASPEDVFSFLCHLTAFPETKDRVAKEFSENPREANNIYNFLLKQLGDDKRAEEYFKTWYYDEDNGYRSAYSSYFHREVWDKATTLLDVVKQSPNLYTAAFRSFVKERGVEPVLGELPQEFGNRESFAKLIQELKDWHKNFKKENTKKTPNELKLATEFDIEVDNHSFNIQAIQDGMSAKLKFRLTSAENPEQTYILKFAPYDTIGNTDRSRKFRDNQALRPDMPYTDSLVDFYLKENNCPNAADIRFFDYEAQAVLYGETKGSIAEFPEDARSNLHKFRKLKEISDIYSLGVHLNDIWQSNFLVDEEGVCKCIDSGHAKYSNIFRPLVSGKQFALANIAGRE